MMSDFLALPEVRAGIRTMGMLNERGVTAIKEMAFDDYYGFADEMAFAVRNLVKLTVRVSMMSQPVGAGAKSGICPRGASASGGPFVRFSGFNRGDRSRRMGGACRDDRPL